MSEAIGALMPERDSGTSSVAVLGAGSWGTALAIHLARTGHDVRLWARDPDVVVEIERTRRNSRYLPGLVIPDLVSPTCDMHGALGGASHVVFALPSHVLRTIAREAVRSIESSAVVISAA
jgi:glycerol-3-phosphate dehydrogenase (NAD(P)+)